MQVETGAAKRDLPLLRLLAGQSGWAGAGEPSLAAGRLIQNWARDDDARRYLQVNLHEGVQWFNHECFDELVWWSFAAEIITHRPSQEEEGPLAAEEASATEPVPAEIPEQKLAEVIGSVYAVAQLLLNAEHRSGYRLDKLEIL
jgi:hypothetical protein